MILNTHPNIRALILDMDGVLWREDLPLVDLPQLFQRIDTLGLKVMLATNNAARTVEEYRQRLQGFGVSLAAEQIATSAQATGYYLSQTLPKGSPVYLIGSPSMIETVQAYGYRQAEVGSDVAAVVVGMDRAITYEKLRRATLLIRAGVPFIATNSDRTFPTPEGLAPGAGAILAAIETATEVAPIICGKPQPTMYRMCLERMGVLPEQTLVVGDRLETDIVGAQALGCPTAVVLSGVSTAAEARAWTPPPDVITENVAALLK